MSNSHEVNGDAGKGNQLPSWKRVVGGGILAVTALGVSAGCSAEVSNEPGPTSSTVAVTPESPKPSVATVEAEPSSDNQLSPKEYQQISREAAARVTEWVKDIGYSFPGGEFSSEKKTEFLNDNRFVTRSNDTIFDICKKEEPLGGGTIKTTTTTASFTMGSSAKGSWITVDWQKFTDCKDSEKKPASCPDDDIAESYWTMNMTVPEYDKTNKYGHLTLGDLVGALSRGGVQLNEIYFRGAAGGGQEPHQEKIAIGPDGEMRSSRGFADNANLRDALEDMIKRMPIPR